MMKISAIKMFDGASWVDYLLDTSSVDTSETSKLIITGAATGEYTPFASANTTINIPTIAGPQGEDGVGITSITSNAAASSGYTTTTVSVALSDGTSQNFLVNAKNGADGSGESGGVTEEDVQTLIYANNSNYNIEKVNNTFYFDGMTAKAAALTLHQYESETTGSELQVSARGEMRKTDVDGTTYLLELPNRNGTLATVDQITGGGAPENALVWTSGAALTTANGKTVGNLLLTKKLGAYASSSLKIAAAETYSPTSTLGTIEHNYFIYDIDNYTLEEADYYYNEVKIKNYLPKVNGELQTRPSTYQTVASSAVSISLGSWASCTMTVEDINYSNYFNAELYQLKLTTSNGATIIVPAKALYESYLKYLCNGNSYASGTLYLRFYTEGSYSGLVSLAVTNISTGEFSPVVENEAESSEINDNGTVSLSITFSLQSSGGVTSVTPTLICTGAPETPMVIDTEATY